MIRLARCSLARLGLALAALVACREGSGGASLSAAELENRMFDFASGAAFGASLGGTRSELTFGRIETSSGGPFVLVVPDVVGSDALPARVEGFFALEPCSFALEHSNFDPTLHPDLQPGAQVSMRRCAMGADAHLVLQNSASGDVSVSAAPRERSSIVVILTDDQRWDTLHAMPLLLDRLASRGVTFSNAYVTTPVCGPSRACFLSGGFLAHDTGVLTNGPPNGGFALFDDTRTLSTTLQRAGFRTGFVGKYINGYDSAAPYIPPGWTRFVANRTASDWFRYSVAEGSSGAQPSEGEIVGPITQYLTDYQAGRAVEFIEEHGDLPFLLLFNPDAPHDPATPAPGDGQLFSDYSYRERAYGEEDLGDKPAWVREAPPYNEAVNDEFHRNQLRSLRAVDRAVADLVDAVERKGKLADTVFLFTSDNGFLWGEHGLAGKGAPYEESIRVPLVVARDGLQARIDDRLVAANLDLPATIYDLAGVAADTGGLSLVPLLEEQVVPWRQELLIESAALGSNEPLLWAGLRVRRGSEEWKYVEYGTGEREFYDLVSDPFEEASAVDAYPALNTEFAAILGGLKGLAITTEHAPPGFVGQPYSLQIQTWGGQGLFVWSLVEGQLPSGLQLDSSTGGIFGTPSAAEEQDVAIQVESQALEAHTGRAQRFVRELRLFVQPW